MKSLFAAVSLFLLLAQPACAADFATRVMDATFKLHHADSTSTCFLIREGEPDKACWLVTAAHSFKQMKGDAATLVLRRQGEAGAYERVERELAIRKGGNQLWHAHQEQDVAVLKLDFELPAEVAPIPLEYLANANRLAEAGVHICSPLFVFTYPERFEANSAGFPVARQGIFSSPPVLPADSSPTFLADFTTFAGDSGGPVFIATKEGEPLVVGIAVGQFHHDEKIDSIYESRVVKHPFRLGIVLHARYLHETISLARTQN